MRKIEKIKWNFRQSGDLKEGIGEDYDVITIGQEIHYISVLNEVTKQWNSVKKKVIEIKEIWTSPNNQFHYFELVLEDNSIIRIYNPNMVYYSV